MCRHRINVVNMFNRVPQNFNILGNSVTHTCTYLEKRSGPLSIVHNTYAYMFIRMC